MSQVLQMPANQQVADMSPNAKAFLCHRQRRHGQSAVAPLQGRWLRSPAPPLPLLLLVLILAWEMSHRPSPDRSNSGSWRSNSPLSHRGPRWDKDLRGRSAAPAWIPTFLVAAHAQGEAHGVGRIAQFETLVETQFLPPPPPPPPRPTPPPRPAAAGVPKASAKAAASAAAADVSVTTSAVQGRNNQAAPSPPLGPSPPAADGANQRSAASQHPATAKGSAAPQPSPSQGSLPESPSQSALPGSPSQDEMEPESWTVVPDPPQFLEQQLVQAERSYRRNRARARQYLDRHPGISVLGGSFEGTVLVPAYPCAREERFGTWDDGGKWVCLAHRPGSECSALREASSNSSKGGGGSGGGGGCKSSRIKPPVVVSIGCHGETSFEQDMNRAFGSTPHTFDPFLSGDVSAEVSALPFLKFYNKGLVSNGTRARAPHEYPAPAWVTLPELLKLIAAPYVDVFKIDCEGCEHGFVEDLALYYARDSQPLGQVQMEVHCINSPSECLPLFVTMSDLGYRIFHTENNPYWAPGYEVAFIHESIVQPRLGVVGRSSSRDR